MFSSAAVGEVRHDRQLAGLARLGEGLLGRVDADGLDLAAALVPGGALGDPFAEHAVLPGIAGKARPPPCLTWPVALSSSRLLSGSDGVDAAAVDFAGQGEEILGGIVAEQGQAEAAFALERAVAGAAAQPARPNRPMTWRSKSTLARARRPAA